MPLIRRCRQSRSYKDWQKVPVKCATDRPKHLIDANANSCYQYVMYTIRILRRISTFQTI